MKNIQKYIDLLKLEKDKAEKKVNECYKAKKTSFAVQASGEAWALSFAIQQAELLLKEETAKGLEKHDFLCECNTCVEQRAKSC